MRGDRDLERHREEERDRVARADTERGQPFGEPRHLPGELREGEGAPIAVLAAEHGRFRLGRPLRPPVDAVPGDVELPAVEPGRPLGPAREINDLAPRLAEIEVHVLDRGGPEPVRVVLRALLELPVIIEAVPAHEADHVRALEHLGARLPDHLRHSGGSLLGGNGPTRGRRLVPLDLELGDPAEPRREALQLKGA